MSFAQKILQFHWFTNDPVLVAKVYLLLSCSDNNVCLPRNGCGLPGFGVSPALVLLEFHGVIVEELVVRASLEMFRVSFGLKPRHLAAIAVSLIYLVPRSA